MTSELHLWRSVHGELHERRQTHHLLRYQQFAKKEAAVLVIFFAFHFSFSIYLGARFLSFPTEESGSIFGYPLFSFFSSDLILRAGPPWLMLDWWPVCEHGMRDDLRIVSFPCSCLVYCLARRAHHRVDMHFTANTMYLKTRQNQTAPSGGI